MYVMTVSFAQLTSKNMAETQLGVLSVKVTMKADCTD